MQRNRLEAFSDGVLAIIITIMVLEFKVPNGTDWEALSPVLPKFLSYILSFIYVGIYWNNHHHMMHTVEKVNGGILWANLHLLFWLSLVPFVTGWLGENHFAELPLAMYGGVLLMAAIAYYILQNKILSVKGKNSLLRQAIGKDFKGKASPIFYSVAIIFSFFIPWLSIILYVFVALMWLIPDKRIEVIFEEKE